MSELVSVSGKTSATMKTNAKPENLDESVTVTELPASVTVSQGTPFSDENANPALDTKKSIIHGGGLKNQSAVTVSCMISFNRNIVLTLCFYTYRMKVKALFLLHL